jgi:PhnB protein
MAKAASPVPAGFHTMTAQLVLDDAAAAIDWYKRAFGAEEVSRSLGPDGKVMHAELKIGDSHVMMNDAMMGAKGAKTRGGSPVSFWLYVADADALFTRAVNAGATVQMPLADQFWGDRAGNVADPEGITWWIATRAEDLSTPEIQERFEAFMKQAAAPAGQP